MVHRMLKLVSGNKMMKNEGKTTHTHLHKTEETLRERGKREEKKKAKETGLCIVCLCCECASRL